MKSLCTDEKFKSFYDFAKKNADGKCDPPILPRQRDIPRRINDGEPQHRFKSVEEMYRKEYFDIIDSTIGGLERRFKQPHFDIVRNIEVVLIDSANGKAATLTNEFVSLYAKDIDIEKLNLQLKLLPDAVKTVSPNGIQICQVTRIQTLCDILNTQSCLKTLLSEVHKLLKIYLTIPVTTASSERNFSALKRIKTYLRNSMTQSRLNHCMLLHIHHDKTDKIDTREIASDFIQNCTTRTTYFGHY